MKILCFQYKIQKILIAITVCSVFLSGWLIVLNTSAEQTQTADTGGDFGAEVSSENSEAPTYSQYLDSCDKSIGTETVVVPAVGYTNDSASAVMQIYPDFEGESGSTVMFDASTPVSFSFSISNAGLYTLQFRYYTGTENSSAITRDILLDGVLPFRESAEISLTQFWQDAEKEPQYDRSGHEIRSRQQQISRWNTAYAENPSSGISGALQYHLSAGPHTITLTPKSGCLTLSRIVLSGKEEIPSYSNVSSEYKEQNLQSASASSNQRIEAEGADTLKSDQTLVSLNDRTSPSVKPYNVNLVRYNSIGAGQWQVVGQWLEWSVDIPESGLYQIGAHYKQNIKTNASSMRELTIDGKLPFSETASIAFPYSGRWQTNAFSDKNGNPYIFYLEKGTHTVRLKATLGDFAPILQSADDILGQLNEIYRKIVVITGTQPDQYANYQFEQVIPDTVEEMRQMISLLQSLSDAVTDFNGEGGASTAAVRRLISELTVMTDDTDKIAARLKTFRDDISSLGTWINDAKSQPLQLDALFFYSPDTPLPPGDVNVFRKAWHYIVQFFCSFGTDYDAIGLTENDTDSAITVWIASGRDQAQILRQKINDDFSPNSNISVKLQLVTATALLPSIVSDNQPDIYLGLPQADPINLALRDAVLDLRQFGDYEETVSSRFSDAEIQPFELDGSAYALPDAIDYPILFVRSDILRELNIPFDDLKDWNSILFKVLPVLQTNSLTIGVPVSIQTYLSFLYQSGGSMYELGGKQSALSSSQAIDAMQSYTELYTQYGLQLAYDFANRFRSGDMPIAVANFTSYNQLSVFAPDIKGQWTMLPMPGTLRDDGTLDRSCTATLTGSVILSGTKSPQLCWQFLKWWTSDGTQKEYGSSLESIIGSAARYNTANLNALTAADWDSDMKESLIEQLKYIRPYTEVPGGYLTSRYYDFAFRYIVYDKDNVRDTMIDAVSSINTEIANKRKEYSLD